MTSLPISTVPPFQESGQSILFQAVTDDGTTIRLLADRCSITEEGLRIAPGGSIISLDAIGQIHAYIPTIPEAQPESLLDAGSDFGYRTDVVELIDDGSGIPNATVRVTRLSQ